MLQIRKKIIKDSNVCVYIFSTPSVILKWSVFMENRYTKVENIYHTHFEFGYKTLIYFLKYVIE